jgi:hypothetical protein
MKIGSMMVKKIMGGVGMKLKATGGAGRAGSVADKTDILLIKKPVSKKP